MSLQVIRIVVCAVIFCGGVKLLFATTAIIDLILNSVALSFVFTVDELVVKAMLQRHDHAHLEDAGSIQVGLRTIMQRKLCSFTGRVGIFWAWWRLLIVTAVVFVICSTHHMTFLSFLSRAQTICLTSGITDGMADVDFTKAVIPVAFPYMGFCESFVDNFAGLGKPNCTAWKDHRDESYTRGYCFNLGDLEAAKWSKFHVSGDEKMRNACTQMWFGLGLASDANHVPALMDFGNTKKFRDRPRMFGCRNEDLVFTITKRTNILYFLFPRSNDEVHMSCRKPAFGPRSAAWHDDALHSGERALPPEFFYKFDPKSPIERQADSCATLEAAHKTPPCNFDRCRVLADVGKGGTFEKYCQKYSLTCAWAAEDKFNTCTPKKRAHCDKPYGDTSDLLCECVLPPQKRSCGKLDTVKKRCPKTSGDIQLDPCRVLLNTEKAPGDSDVKYKSCTHYCEHAGLRCVSQYNTHPFGCEPVSEDSKYYEQLTCDSDLEAKLPSRVCECAARDSRH